MANSKSWKTDLSRGQSWEGKLFFWMEGKYKNVELLSEEFGADFSIDGKLVELKTDFLPYHNFFIETYSNYQTKRIGGPRAALEYGAQYFLYYFVGENSPYRWNLFSFNLEKMVSWLDKEETFYPKRFVNNNDYDTYGCIIPIRVLRNTEFCRMTKVDLSNI